MGPLYRDMFGELEGLTLLKVVRGQNEAKTTVTISKDQESAATTPGRHAARSDNRSTLENEFERINPEEQMDSSLARTHSTRRYAWWLAPVVVVLALAGAWTARASILRGVAEWWVISDPLDRADGIVVLGGRMDVRPFAAADLFKRGLAPQILIANVMRDPLEAMQLWPGQTALTRQLLLKLGVPAEAIVEFGDEVSSTYEEARAVLDWAKRSGAKSVIIPTDSFPTRRVRWTFQHEVAPAGVRIIVYAIKPRGYGLDNWWKDERGLIDFQNEVIKFVHYRLKY